MSFLIGLLTVILVLNCLLLILLVLVQLPKKEAGAGVAFGGAATDALFGSGTGNMLTKITKYATVAFFVLCMSVALLQSNRRSDRDIIRDIEKAGSQLPGTQTTPTTPAAPATVPATSNVQPAPVTAPEN